MKRLAMLTPPESGHLNPSLAVAHALRRRGYEVTFFQLEDAAQKIRQQGFRCEVYGESIYPKSSIAHEHRQLGELQGLAAARFTFRLGAKRLALAADELPTRILDFGVDGIVADEVMAIGPSIAEIARVPVATLSNALPLLLETCVPPPIATWDYQDSFACRLRNRAGNSLIRFLSWPVLRTVNRMRRSYGLNAARSIETFTSKESHCCQIPRSFDFPRETLPPNFTYAGPFDEGNDRPPQEVDLAFEDAQPLVYISLGTLQNRLMEYFRLMAQVCGTLPVNVVLSLGGGSDVEAFGAVPKNVRVLSFAPQTDLLRQADVCVTHGGMNTTLECLAFGVPILVLPVTNDQPANASRITYHGVGRRLELKRCNSTTFEEALLDVLQSKHYRTKVGEFAKEISVQPGSEIAADQMSTLFGM